MNNKKDRSDMTDSDKGRRYSSLRSKTQYQNERNNNKNKNTRYLYSQTSKPKEYGSYYNTNRPKRKMVYKTSESEEGSYHQPLFVEPKPPQVPKNYLNQNIRTLNSQIKPINKYLLSDIREHIQVSRIQKCRVEQSHLKDMTKINLNKQIHLSEEIDQSSSQFLHISKIENQFRKKSIFSGKNSQVPYYKNKTSYTHRKYTQNWNKKQHVRKNNRHSNNSNDSNQSVYSEIFQEQRQQSNNQKITTSSLAIQQFENIPKESREKFRFKQILHKFGNYTKVFEGKITTESLIKEAQGKNRQFLREQVQRESKEKQLAKNLREVNSAAKKANLNSEYIRIRKLEDLEKIDPVYFKKLKQHRNKRLLQMQKELVEGCKIDSIYQAKNFLNQQQEVKKKINHPISLNIIPNTNKLIVQELQFEEAQKLFPIDKIDQNQIQLARKRSQLPREMKLRYFLKHLYLIMDNGQRFGITQDNFYTAMMKVHTQYESEGSYVLFNAISTGNIKLIQSLIQVNQELVYNVDEYGRTPLIFSVQLNNRQIIEYLIKKGSNSDAVCADGKPALFYSFKNKNYQIAQILLRTGASPWSGSNYNYGNLKSTKKWEILFKNARKIAIAMSLCKLKQRKEMWKFFKKHINGKQLFTFD